LPNEPLETFKYIRCFIHFSKERPAGYGGSPEGLESMWHWLDVVLLQIVGREQHGYSFLQYASENGYETGCMSLSLYFRREKKMDDDAEIYRRLVEIRDGYDGWLMKMLLEEEPELAPYCEDFNYKSFFSKCGRELKKRKIRL